MPPTIFLHDKMAIFFHSDVFLRKSLDLVGRKRGNEVAAMSKGELVWSLIDVGAEPKNPDIAVWGDDIFPIQATFFDSRR